eukprot:sb/3470214/
MANNAMFNVPKVNLDPKTTTRDSSKSSSYTDTVYKMTKTDESDAGRYFCSVVCNGNALWSGISTVTILTIKTQPDGLIAIPVNEKQKVEIDVEVPTSLTSTEFPAGTGIDFIEQESNVAYPAVSPFDISLKTETTLKISASFLMFNTTTLAGKNYTMRVNFTAIAGPGSMITDKFFVVYQSKCGGCLVLYDQDRVCSHPESFNPLEITMS